MRVRLVTVPGVTRYPCPFCGLQVISDDAACTFHHEEPLCLMFISMCEALGLQAIRLDGPTAWIIPAATGAKDTS